MGKYINEIGRSFTDKVENLVSKHDADVLASAPVSLMDNLVCVMDNGPFAADAYIYN